jgi:hypothetical protein
MQIAGRVSRRMPTDAATWLYHALAAHVPPTGSGQMGSHPEVGGRQRPVPSPSVYRSSTESETP